MTFRGQIAPCLLVLVIVAGCASTQVSNRQILVNERMPRPERILVCDFIANPSDMPPDADLAFQVEPGPPLTAEQIHAGHQLGAQIADALVAQIRDMGLPAVAALSGTPPRVGDIVIRGYLVSIDEGSTAGRMLIGFGAGGSELKTVVEGYQMTARGLRKLGSGTVESGGGKGPGAAAPAAVAIATGNPVGLIVTGGMKIYGAASGSSTIEGRAKATAKEIADVLKTRFEQQSWIQ
jgi:uncharacterized protein DUF4410